MKRKIPFVISDHFLLPLLCVHFAHSFRSAIAAGYYSLILLQSPLFLWWNGWNHNKTSHHQSAEKSPEPNVTIQNKTLFNCGQKIDKMSFLTMQSFPYFIDNSVIFCPFKMQKIRKQMTRVLLAFLAALINVSIE